MAASYWFGIASKRLSRRRTLRAAGATAAGATLIAACGGGSSSSDGKTAGSSGLVAQPADSTKDARRGGTMKDRAFADRRRWTS